MKCSLWPNSIKTRVTLSALGVFLLSLWMLAFLTTRILEQEISELVAHAQASATTQMATQLDSELGNRLAALERIAVGINADMIENPEAVQQLLEKQPLLQDLFNVSVLAVNSEGIGIADAPFMEERIGINYRDRVDAFAISLNEGRASIGSPMIGMSTHQALIPLAVPIRNNAGEVIGALGGAIDLSKPNFFDDLTSQAYGRTGYYSVISKSRRMVVTSSSPDLIMAELPQPGVIPALDRALQGEERSERYTTTQGIDSLTTVRGLDVTDWLIATITPASEAYKPIKDMQRRMTLMTLIVTLLVGIIIWWLLQRQLRPMLSTVEVLGRMTQQDHSWKSLPLTGGSEINSLIGSFNHLLHVVSAREQETRGFKTMADHAVYGIATTDLEGNMTYVNRFFAEIHGYSPTELIGKHFSIFHTTNQLTHVDNLISLSRQNGYFSPTEVWHVHRHGTEFPMLMSGVLLKDEKSNPKFLAASAVDITGRKQAEEELQSEKAFLKAIIDSIPVMITRFDPHANVLHVNKEFERTIGWKTEELRDINLMEEAYPDPVYRKGVQEYMEKAVIEWQEFSVRTKSGENVISEWSNICLDDGTRIGIGIDVTKRKQVEENLQQSKDMIGLLLDSTAEAIYGVDPQGVCTFCNAACVRILGYDSAVQIIGRNMHDLIHHSHADGTPMPAGDCVLLKDLDQQIHRDSEKFWHADGSSFPVEYWSYPIRQDNHKNLGLVVSFVDITERKQAQLALQQKNEEMEHLVYSVSHDLKSPLVTVKTYAGMLRQDLLNADQQQITEDLNYIDKAANKMQQLLDALMKYSRIGTVDVPAQTVSADQQLHNCLTTLAGILQQHEVQVTTGDLPHQFLGDPMHFGQIWQNLIENAVKYRGDQPQLHIEIGATQEGHDVVFYVRDNGMGIAPEHRERIFNLFSQLNPGSDGSGLGLALVNKIVTIYQGRIWVESDGKGKGSCFYFTLPGALIKGDKDR